jgi:hypothetical protein
MTTYTEIFGGTNIYPSDVSYLSFNLSAADITLSWPLETNAPANGTLIAARIMDVNSTGSSRKVFLPPANQSAPGECFLFSNTGSTTFTVVNNAGTVVCTLVPGTLWQVYMTSNTTVAGVWASYQFGSTTSTVNAGALAGAGLVAIANTLNEAIVTFPLNTNFTIGLSNRAQLLSWGGASGTLTLTLASTLGAAWFTYIKNAGTSAISIAPTSPNTIDNGSSLTLPVGASTMVVCDGTRFYTFGLSNLSAPTSFDYTAISIPGTGNYTLSGTELNRIAYNFTGILTGNRTVTVPTTIQQYWVTNATTGAFTLTVKTLAGTGIAVQQGNAQILYCDGTNVVLGQSQGVTVPVPVASGGTGATTANAALVNLGGTATGIPLFTAASAAAARTTIDAPSSYEAISFTVAMS